MAIVILGKLIGLLQLVYWLKPIKSFELYLFYVMHKFDPRRMFYNMS